MRAYIRRHARGSVRRGCREVFQWRPIGVFEIHCWSMSRHSIHARRCVIMDVHTSNSVVRENIVGYHVRRGDSPRTGRINANARSLTDRAVMGNQVVGHGVGIDAVVDSLRQGRRRGVRSAPGRR